MLFIYITRLASNKICSPPNKIHRELGRAKDLPAPLYVPSFLVGSDIGPRSVFHVDVTRVCSVSPNNLLLPSIGNSY